MEARWSRPIVLHPDHFKANLRNSRRGIRNGGRTRPRAHLDQPRGVVEQSSRLAREIFGKMIIVVDDDRGTDPLENAGVVELLHVAMERIGDEDSGASRKGDIGDGASPRAGDYEAGAGQGGRNILDKGDDLGLRRDCLILGPQQLHIRLAALVNERPFYNTFSPDFESPKNPEIEAVGARGAS